MVLLQTAYHTVLCTVQCPVGEIKAVYMSLCDLVFLCFLIFLFYFFFAGEEVCIETGTGEKIKDEDEDIYQFLPSRRGPSQGEMLASERAVANEPVMAYEFEPYTQIWLCGRGDRKGVLQVFTYNDGHAGHFVSAFEQISLVNHNEVFLT